MIEILYSDHNTITIRFRELLTNGDICIGERCSNVDLNIEEAELLIKQLQEEVKKCKGDWRYES